MMLVNTANALVQTQVDNGLRGRVMGIYMLTFQGLMPIGSLVIGLLASRLNEPIAVAMSGFVLIVMAIWVFIRKPNLRKLE
jgi:MFS family permease